MMTSGGCVEPEDVKLVEPKLPVIYLSGPVSLGGMCSEEETMVFIHRFKMEAARLRALGYDVIDPTNCEPQDSWQAYMRIHIPSVCRADLVAVLPNWEQSRGSLLEVFIANQLGISVRPVAKIQ